MVEWEGETWRGKWRQNGNIYHAKRWRLSTVTRFIGKQYAQWPVLMKTKIGIYRLAYFNLFNCMIVCCPLWYHTRTWSPLAPATGKKTPTETSQLIKWRFSNWISAPYVMYFLYRRGEANPLSASVASPLVRLRVRRYLSQYSFSSNS